MRTFLTLFKHEWKLSIRNMNMVIFAILMPLVVLVILGFLYGAEPVIPNAGSSFPGSSFPRSASAGFSYLAQSFGPLCGISICAGGVMGLPLVVSDYRERKLLKRFQVTPASPVLLLAVQFSIDVLYAAISLLTLIPAARFWNVPMSGLGPAFFGSWLLTLVSSLSIGMMVGGIAKNPQQASVIACLLYFPMLLFSGATLPFEVLPEAVQNLSGIFPMTQGLQLMKAAFLGLPAEDGTAAVLGMAALSFICFGISIRFFRWE